ncbi:MAG: ATP cone domain-containing protein [Candidatus Nanosalina sp.]
MKVAKKNGKKEELDEGKLWDSLYYPAREANYDEEEAVDIADKTKQQLLDWMKNSEDNVFTTKEISLKAEEFLREIDDHVALMYDKHLDIN